MEEEIDLRPYVAVLLRGWKWITVIVAAVLGIGVVLSFGLPPVYEATAIVAVTNLREEISFDSRITSTNDSQPLRALPELALSNAVLQNVLDHLDPPIKSINRISDLRGHLQANFGEDLHIIYLVVSSQDPAETAQLANVWAEQFVAWTNIIYGQRDANKARFFEEQLAQSALDLETVDQALIVFQGENRFAVISNTLVIANQTYTSYLEDQKIIDEVKPDLQRLRDALAQRTAETTFADELTILLLQVQAINGSPTVPLQINLNTPQSLIGENREEQIVFLDRVLADLDAKWDDVNKKLVELESSILTLQQQKQASESSYEQLLLSRSLTLNTYTAIAYQVEEERLLTQDADDGVMFVSRAIPPVNPVGPRKLYIVVLSGIFGFLLGIFVVFVNAYRKSQKKE